MAIVTIAELKTYFETGDRPTQQQFVNLIDTLATGGVATPNLQQVTTAGFTTTSKIISSDGGLNYSVINNGNIDISTGVEAVTIEASLVTSPYNAQLPDKLSGTETFAMLSDIADSNTNAVDLITVKLTASINKGQAVYISGANGTNILVAKADNTSESTSSKTLGLLATSGATNAIVNVVTSGLLDGINTFAATIGDAVWLGTAGNLLFGLANKPYAPAHLVYIGVVSRVSATVGEIIVSPQNGFELKEIHDVFAQTPAAKDGLFFDATTSLWKARQVLATDIDANVSNVEFGYLDGVSSSIQTQINGKQATLVSGTNIKSVEGSTLLGSTALVISREIQLACSDETTALTTGTAKVTFRAPRAMVVTGVRASLTTAQSTGSIVTVDINDSGTSILSTKLTIDNTEKTSVTAAIPPVISDSAIADDAEITIDIDIVGDGTAKGLKVTILYTI